VYGDTEKVLRLPEGEPTYNLLKLAQPGRSEEIQVAAKNALVERCTVTVTGLRDRETGELNLGLRLTPLQTSENGGPARLLVSFIRQADESAQGNGGNGSRRESAEPSDPQEWKDAVRISHEELEASREELQALNEELKASNEQLNISNEDLSKVNTELQEKIA